MMTRQEQLCKWLQSLPPCEEQVLRARFGIDAEARESQSSGTRNLSLTALQVEQLEWQGLRNLRRMPLTEIFGSESLYTAHL